MGVMYGLNGRLRDCCPARDDNGDATERGRQHAPRARSVGWLVAAAAMHACMHACMYVCACGCESRPRLIPRCVRVRWLFVCLDLHGHRFGFEPARSGRLGALLARIHSTGVCPEVVVYL